MPYKAPSTAFTKGDPRAIAGGKKSRRGPDKPKDPVEDGAAIMTRLIEGGLKMPEGHTAPSAMDISEMARSVVPSTLRFAIEVLDDAKSEINHKFTAAGLVLKMVPANAAETEEITKLKGLVDDLRIEHQEIVKEMAQESASLRKENAVLIEQLDEARSKIRTTPAEKITLPKAVGQ